MNEFLQYLGPCILKTKTYQICDIAVENIQTISVNAKAKLYRNHHMK